jgi:hypothetical protein
MALKTEDLYAAWLLRIIGGSSFLDTPMGADIPCLDPDVASQYPVLNFCPVCGYSLARNRMPPNSRNLSSIFPVPIMELNDQTSLGAGRVDPFGMFPFL